MSAMDMQSVNRMAFGAVMLADLYDRLQCGAFGPEPLPHKALTAAVWVDAGYRLDAPDLMPAGSTVQTCSEGFDDDVFYDAELRMFERESDAGDRS